MPANSNDPVVKTPEKALTSEDKANVADLKKASETLKAKIAEAKDRNDMPIDSALGNPKWDKDAADGHLDIPDDDSDG